MEGLANLSTDRDYNQLVKHVNANRPRLSDVSCYSERIFSIQPKIVIQPLKLCQKEIFSHKHFSWQSSLPAEFAAS
jgi:hypothetical protein